MGMAEMRYEQRQAFGEAIKQILINQIDAISVIEGTNKQGALRDLLTDLRHIAEDEGLNIHEAVKGSLEVFLVEREEAGLPVRPHPDFRVIETGSTFGKEI
jgi:hypothetical protein